VFVDFLRPSHEYIVSASSLLAKAVNL
jgi:hypothetical protein